MSRFQEKVESLIAGPLVFFLGRPSAAKLNNALLHFVLRGGGYNNPNMARNGEQKFIKRISKQNLQVCIDVGANTGGYSRTLLSHSNTDVIAFEPLPTVFDELKKLKDLFPGRLTIVNEALGKESGEFDLYFGSSNTEFASLSKSVNEIDYVGAVNKEILKIRVNTLDNYFETGIHNFNEIDLIKIDTEGYEYEVLLGAQKTIKEFRPKFIQIEYNWHQLFQGHTLFTIGSLLPGYVLFQILPYGKCLLKRDARRPEPNIFHYSNFVFMREDVSF